MNKIHQILEELELKLLQLFQNFYERVLVSSFRLLCVN